MLNIFLKQPRVGTKPSLQAELLILALPTYPLHPTGVNKVETAAVIAIQDISSAPITASTQNQTQILINFSASFFFFKMKCLI